MSNELTFVTVDTQSIIDTLITAVEESTGDTLYPGDVRRLFIENITPVIAAIYAKINDTGRQCMLRYARGEFLDALGENAGCTRLQPDYASCTVQFTAAAGHPDITIPMGTRVSPDGKLFFATTAAVTITSGSNTAQVEALALGTGSAYNDLTPGQITMIIDPMPWLASVTNTTKTAGGMDLEEDGSSEPPYTAYRERIREAPASYSTAGPTDAYIYWAKSVSQDIASVTVLSPNAATIEITVLMKDGMPSDEIKAAVLAACSDRTRRPLGDHVVVYSPGVVTFEVDVTYTINSAYTTSVTAIREAIEGDGGAIAQYIAWQTAELGRAVNPSQLIRYMFGAGDFDAETRALLVQGINSVTVTSPTSDAVSKQFVAKQIGTPTITFGGVV